MKSIKVDNQKTGWVVIPATTKKIVAHFNDGHKEVIDLVDYITMNSKKKSQVNQIDCYTG
jgi:hypothetical protein